MHKACIVCKNEDIFTKYIVEGFHILRCKRCSLLFVGERLSQKQLQAYYEKMPDDFAYSDTENIKNLKYYYLTLIGLISKKISTGKILDVGCSSGQFLDCLQGWECHGIERDSRYAQKARLKYGNNIHIGTLQDYESRQGYFDVITLQDVLDHMPDPLQALTKCHALLKPDGLIAVKVHDFSCLYALISGSKCYAFTPPNHLVYFNRKNLTQALSLSGFQVEQYRYLAHLLVLRTVLFRLSRNNKRSFFYRLSRIISDTPLGKIRIRKNLHDIVTVLARKC